MVGGRIPRKVVVSFAVTTVLAIAAPAVSTITIVNAIGVSVRVSLGVTFIVAFAMVVVAAAIRQEALGIYPGSIWQEMGQRTLQAELTVALLEVLARQLICG